MKESQLAGIEVISEPLMTAGDVSLRATMRGSWWIVCAGVVWVWNGIVLAEEIPKRDAQLLIVRGADGDGDYGQEFAEQERLWTVAGERAEVRVTNIGPKEGDAALEVLRNTLPTLVAEAPGQLWIVLMGHGTFDGRDAKFNLAGPDLTPMMLVEMLQPFRGELVFIHTGSASQPFAAALKGDRRILISATKGGDEVFFTRFGKPFAEAIGGLELADQDEDGQVSLLEAFLYAAAKVISFYETEERIATEHALLDDNGDGVGIRAEAFEGLRPKRDDDESTDGDRARKIALVLSEEESRLSDADRQRRDALEEQVRALRSSRDEMDEEDYYRKMELLLVELARIDSGSKDKP